MSLIDTLQNNVSFNCTIDDSYYSSVTCEDCLIVLKKFEGQYGLVYVSLDTKQVVYSHFLKTDHLYSNGTVLYTMIGFTIVSIFKDKLEICGIIQSRNLSNFKIKYAGDSAFLVVCVDDSGKERLLVVGNKSDKFDDITELASKHEVSIRDDRVRLFIHKEIVFVVYQDEDEVIMSSIDKVISTKCPVKVVLDDIEQKYSDTYIRNKLSSLVFSSGERFSIIDIEPTLNKLISEECSDQYEPVFLSHSSLLVTGFESGDKLEIPYIGNNAVTVHVKQNEICVCLSCCN